MNTISSSLAAGSPLADTSWISTTSLSTLQPSPKVYVSTQFQFQSTRFSINSFIDCGAEGNFIDSSIVKRFSIPLVHLATPIPLKLADGSSPSAGPAIYKTIPLLMTIDCHQEYISFIVTTSPHQVILGISWLSEHDPNIIWSQRTVQFHSTFCKSNCFSSSPDPKLHLNQPEQTLSISMMSFDSFIEQDTSDLSDYGVFFINQQLNLCSLSSVHKDIYPYVETLPTVPSVSPQAQQIFDTFPDVFSKSNADTLPHHRPFDCSIPLQPDAEIPHGRVYNLTVQETQAMEEYIKENLSKGFIRPSSSPAGAPCFFTKKKDGSLRLCVDYRGLNKVTVKDRYPLPLISDLIRSLSQAKIFSALDLRGAYNLVRIKEGDEWKTAFRNKFGHFEYLVMPFGLANAPSIFQRMMNTIFQDVLDKFVVIYLDDILIFSNNQEEHAKHVKFVLDRLRSSRLFCKKEKCQLFVTEIAYLGYVITENGVKMDPTKLTAIANWPTPNSAHDIQIFMGFANFYRRFIRNFAAISQPLTALLKKTSSFVWNSRAQGAFDSLKYQFTNPPLLIHPNPTKPFFVETDASDHAIGAVLSQLDAHQIMHPVAYFSRQMIPAERNYEIYDKELLSIIGALKEWRHYLLEAVHQVTIFTDHKNLEYFMANQQLSRRQARWSLFLSEFDLKIHHQAGSLNTKADALSRRPDYVQQNSNSEPSNFQRLFKAASIASLNANSEPSDFLQEVREHTATDHWSSRNKALFTECDGLLYKDNLLYLPSNETRLHVLKKLHDHPTSGHFGISRTIDLVSRNYWFPKIKQFITDYVKSCSCVTTKSVRHKPYGLLRPLQVADRPWSHITTDFIVELPRSKGFNAISVWVCRLTKMAHFVPCNTNVTADGLAKIFRDNILKLHGIPVSIVSDRGPQFISKFWKAFCKSLSISVDLSTAYRPCTDGQSEIVNQILEQYLRNYINYHQDDWCDLLPLAELAVNNAINASTKTSPFFANFGFHPKTNDLPTPAQDSLPFDNLKIIDNLDTLKKHLKEAQERYKKFADTNRLDFQLSPGDLVFLSSKNIKTNRPSQKLDHKRLGPYKVIEQIGKSSYRLDLPRTMNIHNVFHISLLEPHHSSQIPGRTPAPPTAIIVDGQLEYEVEAILNSRIYRRQGQYLIKWKGYKITEATWEHHKEVDHLDELIHKFHSENQEKPGPWATIRRSELAS